MEKLKPMGRPLIFSKWRLKLSMTLYIKKHSTDNSAKVLSGFLMDLIFYQILRVKFFMFLNILDMNPLNSSLYAYR